MSGEDAAMGRVIAVVGPSGVGKDSVMAGLAARRPAFRIARRVITRAANLGGEAFEPVSEAEFARRDDEGAFCLSWQAHGLHYGIPVTVKDAARAGADVLVNLSRTVLPRAAAVFPRFMILSLTARPETLAHRLAARDREDREAIARRLSRSGAPLPGNLDVIAIANDGPLEDTVTAVLAALAPAEV